MMYGSFLHEEKKDRAIQWLCSVEHCRSTFVRKKQQLESRVSGFFDMNIIRRRSVENWRKQPGYVKDPTDYRI